MIPTYDENRSRKCFDGYLSIEMYFYSCYCVVMNIRTFKSLVEGVANVWRGSPKRKLGSKLPMYVTIFKVERLKVLQLCTYQDVLWWYFGMNFLSNYLGILKAFKTCF